MIIGNGLLANAFLRYEGDNKIIIFASGVSNSSTSNAIEFERELILLKSNLVAGKKLIYFSTISIYDPELAHTPYIKHKLNIETIISKSEADYIIFRLPILLGRTSNPHTLCNFVFNQLTNNQPIYIYSNACRYLIDVDDLTKLLPNFIDDDSYNRTIIDIAYNNPIKIEYLVSIFEEILGVKSEKKYLDKGGCYEADTHEFRKVADQYGMYGDKEYLTNTIKKYYQ